MINHNVISLWITVAILFIGALIILTWFSNPLYIMVVSGLYAYLISDEIVKYYK